MSQCDVWVGRSKRLGVDPLGVLCALPGGKCLARVGEFFGMAHVSEDLGLEPLALITEALGHAAFILVIFDHLQKQLVCLKALAWVFFGEKDRGITCAARRRWHLCKHMVKPELLGVAD